MKEVTDFGIVAESEIKSLLKVLMMYEVSARSHCRVPELDLATLKSSHHYVKEVQDGLERLASLAKDGVQELITRRKEFHKWQSTRMKPPTTPAVSWNEKHFSSLSSLE